MASLLQLVDRTTDAVVFDFNDETGAANPSAVQAYFINLNLGQTERETDFFRRANAPGGIRIRNRLDLTQMSLRFRAKAANYDALAAGIGSLGNLLSRPETYCLKWRGHGSAVTRWIDFEDSDLPALLRDQELSIYKILALVDDVDGLPISMLRQPLLRRASQSTVAAAVPNNPASASGRVYRINNPGNAPTPAILKITGDAGAKIQELLIGHLAGTDALLDDYETETKFAQCEASGLGWTSALSNNTASAPDADASGGAAAQTTYTANPTVMNKRVRLTRTTKLDSLRGTWEVYARVKAPAVSSHVLQLRWGPSIADPPANSNPEVSHAWTTGSTTFSYVDVSLGRIHIPSDIALGGVGFELWSRRSTGTGNLNWDCVFLMPVESSSSTRVDGGSSESWTAAQLVTPVSNPAGGTAAILNAGGFYVLFSGSTHNVGTPPNAGVALPVGRHRYTFDLQGDGSATAVTIRVRNITDGADAVSVVTPILGVRRSYSIEFDAVSGKAYQAQVDDPAASAGDTYLYGISHTFTPSVGANEVIRTDPERLAVEKLDSSGNLLQPLSVEGGVPIWLEPGDNDVILIPRDIKSDTNAPDGESKLARSPVMQATLSPRDLL